MDKIINQVILRNGEIGQKLKAYSDNMKPIPNELVLDCVKGILFKEERRKYILVNYPKTYADVFY